MPFSNGTEVDWFVSARCARCVHRDPEDGGFCLEFLPVMLAEWPDIIVPSDTSPLGVDCSKYEHDPAVE